MIRVAILGLCTSFLTGFTPLNEDRRDPMGERSDYQLDKKSSRTSSMVSKAAAFAVVDEFLPEHEQGPSYNVTLSYDVTVQLYGRFQGTAKWAFPENFFTPSFMEDLRRTGSYVSADYKMKYEGRADATTLDGGVYPQSDVVLIYDIKTPDNSEFARILRGAAGFDPNQDLLDGPSVKDMKIRAHVYDGIPVLGAVKLDLSGTVQGIAAKAGFDLKR